MQGDHPVLGARARVVAGVHELPERQEPDLRCRRPGVDGVGDVRQHLVGAQRDLRADVRQPPMAGPKISLSPSTRSTPGTRMSTRYLRY